ncbi:MAG: hypothetical protein AVDCRST_MAG77-1653 [uncultured Chloroflexi bacterium]|uniref:Uncharacterized protein n=1 Tax=uncultured Chloroflexota bacterium TaxID=166587 RepID=A0A6J4I2L6_9CHLR|nr:MAG: hypothetical protein AVDCRST_MAG77-1653 [uncultured Chloroflexota bacterium]
MAVLPGSRVCPPSPLACGSASCAHNSTVPPTTRAAATVCTSRTAYFMNAGSTPGGSVPRPSRGRRLACAAAVGMCSPPMGVRHVDSSGWALSRLAWRAPPPRRVRADHPAGSAAASKERRRGADLLRWIARAHRAVHADGAAGARGALAGPDQSAAGAHGGPDGGVPQTGALELARCPSAGARPGGVTPLHPSTGPHASCRRQLPRGERQGHGARQAGPYRGAHAGASPGAPPTGTAGDPGCGARSDRCACRVRARCRSIVWCVGGCAAGRPVRPSTGRVRRNGGLDDPRRQARRRGRRVDLARPRPAAAGGSARQLCHPDAHARGHGRRHVRGPALPGRRTVPLRPGRPAAAISGRLLLAHAGLRARPRRAAPDRRPPAPRARRGGGRAERVRRRRPRCSTPAERRDGARAVAGVLGRGGRAARGGGCGGCPGCGRRPCPRDRPLGAPLASRGRAVSALTRP